MSFGRQKRLESLDNTEYSVEISERRWYNWNGSEKSKQIYCQEGKEVK